LICLTEKTILRRQMLARSERHVFMLAHCGRSIKDCEDPPMRLKEEAYLC
jgi:hypothetical protein